MTSSNTSVNRFICTSKRCLRVFRSLRLKRVKGDPIAGDVRNDPQLTIRRETFYLSSASLDKRRPSDSSSVNTIITLLDDCYAVENLYNEQLEQHNRSILIEALV
ncbi:uncharacterized protein [Rhodnius prolixus]|uniref:uncharacterized protein n=1 Tax=Rhodnius prolixus TaxID=13249 RepID=UPI003D18B0F8